MHGPTRLKIVDSWKRGSENTNENVKLRIAHSYLKDHRTRNIQHKISPHNRTYGSSNAIELGRLELSELEQLHSFMQNIEDLVNN
jgi:hypothetical protein